MTLATHWFCGTRGPAGTLRRLGQGQRVRQRGAPCPRALDLAIAELVLLGHEEALGFGDQLVAILPQGLADALGSAAGKNWRARHPGVEGGGQAVSPSVSE